jgi:Domain of unknown function (DUF1707)
MSEETGGVPGGARDLRVSDAEREHVVRLLERATGSGLLDLDEFTQRVDTALAARTRAELNVVLLDLPGLTHPDRPAHLHPPRPAARPTGRSTSNVPAGDHEVRSLLASTSRRGAWDVPAHLPVRAVLGSVELDFTEAHIPHDVVEIELDVVAGSVELRVPEGSRVETALRSTMASVENRTRARADGAGGPVFRVRGSIRAGSVEIKPPKRLRWWRR